jgi:ParB family chromosome partitioning protein
VKAAGANPARDGEPVAIWLPLRALQPAADQPRKFVDEEKLRLLTASIRARGRVVQPLVVRPRMPGCYEIVCGERRWRAAQAAGLTEAPVVVRELSDEEAFEESLLENLDREDMTPADEARAVARLADAHGVQETARRLGKPHAWVSKRKRIAEAPPFVVAFLDRGGSTDIEALYELARLADTDPVAADAIIADHVQGGRLRDRVKAAARAARGEEDGEPAAGTPRAPGNRPEASEEAFKLEDRARAAAGVTGDDADHEEDDHEDDQGRAHGGDGREPAWLPSDAPELDEPFDDHSAIVVTSVEARRAGHLVFTTPAGLVIYELTPLARDQLQVLLR